MPDGSSTQTQTQQTTQTQTTQPWYSGVEGVDDVMVGTWTNRGLHTKDPKQVAVEMTKAALEAQRFVGAPPNELIRLPKDASDEAGWQGVWQRLGMPKEAKAYDFSGVKFKDGSQPEEKFLEVVRKAAFDNKLPVGAATSVLNEFIKYMDAEDAVELAEHTATLEAQKTSLKTNWGPNYDANKFVASQAAIKMGIDPETLTAADKIIGHDKVMEMFRKIGVALGEDKYIAGSPASGNKVMTKQEATARKAELMGDKIWAQKFINGDAEAKREMKALDVILSAA